MAFVLCKLQSPTMFWCEDSEDNCKCKLLNNIFVTVCKFFCLQCIFHVDTLMKIAMFNGAICSSALQPPY